MNSCSLSNSKIQFTHKYVKRGLTNSSNRINLLELDEKICRKYLYSRQTSNNIAYHGEISFDSSLGCNTINGFI